MSANTTIAILSIVIILAFTAVYGFPRRKESGAWVKRHLSPTFARVYGLLSLAVMAVAVALVSKDDKVLTPVFTLFGTIAGYLAGSKAESVPSSAVQAEPGDDSARSLELN